ncbi:MAG: hypothetical protein KAS32_00635 [Candidatus Peribacteraceae bacterium]|nr:hypothetical protein [Candidatus Peribacteraceae bacterium]
MDEKQIKYVWDILTGWIEHLEECHEQDHYWSYNYEWYEREEGDNSREPEDVAWKVFCDLMNILTIEQITEYIERLQSQEN